MNLAGLFGPDWMSLWVTGTAFVILALWLFLLDVANRAQRVFAVLLAFRGLTFLIAPVRGNADTVADTILWANLGTYVVLPLVPLVLYFLSLYPRRRGLASIRWGPALLLLLTLGSVAWFLLDHDSCCTLAHASPVRYVEYGPLFVLVALRLPAFALAGLVLAFDYRRSPEGSAGFSLFLIVAAFTLNGLFDGAVSLIELARDLRDPSVDLSGWGWTPSVLPALALPIAAATLFVLAPVLKRAAHQSELQEVTRFFAFAVPLALASALVTFLPGQRAEDIVTFILGAWRLVIPFLIAYALMRYQLFDIDLRLKEGVRRGIIIGAFTLTFFLVSEAAEGLIQEGRGPIFGILSAGFLALASRPVQSFANRLSDSFMPDTKPIAEQTHQERLQFYLEQVRLIRHDGETTPKERAMLDRLQTTLSLSDADVAFIQANDALPAAKAQTAPKPKAPQPAGPATTKDSRLEIALKGALVAGAMALLFGMLSQVMESLVPALDVIGLTRAVAENVAGLLSAAMVALLLGPLETLADRLTHRLDPRAVTDAKDAKERRRAFGVAMQEALADGSLSERDLEYLAGLQHKLRITRTTRWRLERRARRNLGLGEARRGGAAWRADQP